MLLTPFFSASSSRKSLTFPLSLLNSYLIKAVLTLPSPHSILDGSFGA
nr:MAG TPA: hypothetical protein [Bacteriophage sp.]